MKTVLVVDDSDIVLELVRKALEAAGYTVITRNKPSGSVAAILRDKPDIVLLDVNMPTLSGDTIAKILAKMTQNPETMVLLHSSLSIENLKLKALATGAHGYIQKTDSATELIRRIEYWLSRSRFASSNKLQASSAFVSSSAVRGAPSSGKLEAAKDESKATPLGGHPSSSKFRAAPPIAGTPAPAPSRTSTPAGARSSASSFRAASPVTSPPSFGGSGAASSRSLRAAKPAVAPGEKQSKVLFVDDDWKMLSSYKMMMAGHFDADFVSSCDDAFQRMLSDSPPDVVVCDVMMPVMTGADLYRRAVLLDKRWARRFVFITGAASTPSVAEFLNTLDVRVFHKPVLGDRLLETLKQMTDGSRR
jgi:DNA-binding response OmpR family regulator